MESFRITVRVYGETLKPHEFAEEIKVPPTTSYSRGDPVSKHGRAAELRQKYGAWMKAVECEDPPEFSSALNGLLAELPANFADIVQGHGAEADVYVGGFGVRDQSTIFMDEQLIQSLAAKQLSVVFDLYVKDEHEDE